VTALSAWLGARLLAGMIGSTPFPTPLVVVVDAAVVDGDALAARLVVGLEPLVRILPLAPGAAASIRVTGELLDFRVGLTLGPDGMSTWSWCPCTHAELVAHVQRRLARALRPPMTCPPAPLAIAPPPASRPPRPVQTHEPAPRRSGRLGAVLMGVGGLALGTGAGLVIATRVVTDERWVPRADPRPFGIAAMAVGTAVLAAGASLLFLELRSSRARRRALHP